MSDPAAASSFATFPGWALALLAAAALAWAAWATWAWRRERREAYAARTDQASFLAFADDWYWQTDATHALRLLKVPAAASDVPPVWLGRAPWELWSLEETGQARADALRDRFLLEAPMADLGCRWHPDGGTGAGGTASEAWRLSATPQYDRAGRFRGYFGCLRRVQPTEAPARAAPASGVADAAGEARAGQEQAAEASGFTYTVSHDLRAPIRVVEGFTRIVKEDYGHLLDRVGIDHLDRVLSAAARMNSMIDALLALSRLSQQPLSSQTVNLSQIAGFIVDDLQRAHPEHRVTVHIEPGLTTQGDPTLLRMALENLLGNAWKYTGKTRDPCIWLEADRRRPTPVYRLRDNGAGFDMRFADRLFGVFQRLHGASEFPGTGVGLASVRRIVRRHGGEIWAESEPGRGATFHFTLGPGSTRP